MKKDKSKAQKVIEVDALGQINENAAGIDIGAEEFYVAVPKGRDAESVRSFSNIHCGYSPPGRLAYTMWH